MNIMKKSRKIAACTLSVIIVLCMILATVFQVAAASETLPNGYVIDMDDIPKVHFADHPEWVEIYDATWEVHKGNIDIIPAAINPDQPYYIDEAFSANIFAWDTMFMMLFDKYGLHQFPTLASLDNFYIHQTDNPGGEDDGYIPREIKPDGTDYHNGYTDERSMNPPLWAWAEWEQYQIHGDLSRFSQEFNGKTLFERLESHYEFIERYKKLDNGLYGKTNGLGNGLDNTFNQGDGQTYNDLSIQQAQFAYYIGLIAEEMGDVDTANYYYSEHERISGMINDMLWSDEAQMYSNLAADGVTKTNVSTPTNLWALAGRVATEERAEAIIQEHGRNSEKLFRPNGLATASYDHPNYVAEGGYWRGAFWAPTSFQYIKGLSEYGYTDMAFEEALRHLNTVSEVFQRGKDGGYVTTPTVWENYSSEYVRNGYTGAGSSSRGNFAGWTGCLSIGVIIEDIIGINISAPNNEITWNIHLPEEHGISNLYMNHEGTVNRVSLMANERSSAKDAVTFTVTAEEDVTLHVINGSKEQTYDITAGTHTYTLAGDSEEPGQSGYIGAGAVLLDEVADSYTKEILDETALDYVIFGADENETITDGIKQQTGKGASLIYNVNTVGYAANSTANRVTFRDSEAMQSLGFSDAQDVLKRAHAYGSEGFMAMAPAINSMQTLSLIVGVQNATAELSAVLSDSSCEEAVLRLSAGAEEEVYVIDIPYTAANENRYVLAKWTIVNNLNSAVGNVSLKGIILTEGGLKYPGKPVDMTLDVASETVTVNAQPPAGEEYDTWKVYIGPEDGQYDTVIETGSLPYTVEGLQNYTKYYVTVAGVVNGRESMKCSAQAALPEEEGTTDATRLQKDLNAMLPIIFNGNEAHAVTRDFVTDVTGPVYGSTVSFASDSHGDSHGVRNTGAVVRPVGDMNDKETQVTIIASYKDETIVYPVDVRVKAIDTENEAYVAGITKSKYTGRVYLTDEGSRDWVQVCQNIDGVNPQARKAGGSGIGTLYRNHDAVPGGEQGMMTDANLYYVASDAGIVPPIDRYGSQMRGVGNYLEFDLAYSEKVQRVYVYAGIWYAKARVEFLVNGELCASETMDASALMQYRTGFDFKLENPEDTATVRLVLLDMTSYGKGNGSTYLNAVTLQEMDSPLNYIPKETEPVIIEPKEETASFAGTIDLTAQGDIDWLQLQADTETDYARKAGGSGLYGFKRNHDAVPSGEKGVIRDGSIYYTYSDADANYPNPVDRYGMQTRGIGNGFEFNVGYSSQRQTLKVYTGVYNSRAKLEFIVNGDVRYESDIVSSSGVQIFCSTFDYLLGSPDDEAIVRLTLAETSGSGSTFIFGATLGTFVGEYIHEYGTAVPAYNYTQKIAADDPNIENSTPDGKNIGGIQAGSWLTYHIDVEETGLYDFSLEYAASSATNMGLTILLDDQPIGTLNQITPTGGWQNWSYVTVPDLPLTAGSHVLKLSYSNAGTNLRSLNFKFVEEIQEPDIGNVTLYKTDFHTDEPLENAQFALQVRNNNRWENYQDVKSTYADGEVAFYDLPAGTYRFAETEAAPGYDKSTVIYSQETFTVEEGQGKQAFRIEATNEKLPLKLAMLEYAIEYAQRQVSAGELADVIEIVAEKFYTALDTACDVLDRAKEIPPAATQEEVDQAAEELIEIVHYLEFKGNKTDLRKLIALAEQYEEEGEDAYIPSTYEAFISALQAARQVEQDAYAFTEEIEEAWETLLDALFGLRLKPDKGRLEQLVNQAKGLNASLYTQVSFSVVESAVMDAENTLANPEATKEDVKKSESDLKTAMLSLVEKAERITEKKNTLSADDISARPAAAVKNMQNPKTEEGSLTWMVTLLFVGACMVYLLRKRIR